MKKTKDYEDLDVQYKIFANLFLVSNKLQITMDRDILEITAKQWFLLAALSYMDGAPTLKELAEAVDYSHQNVRQLINKLEAKGFVTIEKDKVDQRAIRIFLTEKVKEWELQRQNNNVEFVNKMFANISENQLAIVEQTLEQLYQNLGGME